MLTWWRLLLKGKQQPPRRALILLQPFGFCRGAASSPTAATGTHRHASGSDRVALTLASSGSRVSQRRHFHARMHALAARARVFPLSPVSVIDHLHAPCLTHAAAPRLGVHSRRCARRASARGFSKVYSWCSHASSRGATTNRRLRRPITQL